MNVLELIGVIENTAPLELAASWDKSGVQVASFSKTCLHVAVMLDPKLEQVEKALGAGCDFILAHHPLAMQARFPDKADDYLKILSLLLGNKVWLYSAHTSLDANPNGPVRWLASALRLQDICVLEPIDSDIHGTKRGFGFIGELPCPYSYDEALSHIGGLLKKKEWSACGPKPALVERIACCPGSGSSLAEVAEKQGADIFITGDVKYHAALHAPLRILDVGHFCLEEEMMKQFALSLQKEIPIQVTFFSGTDPLSLENCS